VRRRFSAPFMARIPQFCDYYCPLRGEHHRARAALTRIAGFFTQLRKTAEQLTALER
jgi:hypothetical protein